MVLLEGVRRALALPLGVPPSLRVPEPPPLTLTPQNTVFLPLCLRVCPSCASEALAGSL